MSDGVLVAIITAVGGVIVALVTALLTPRKPPSSPPVHVTISERERELAINAAPASRGSDPAPAAAREPDAPVSIQESVTVLPAKQKKFLFRGSAWCCGRASDGYVPCELSVSIDNLVVVLSSFRGAGSRGTDGWTVEIPVERMAFAEIGPDRLPGADDFSRYDLEIRLGNLHLRFWVNRPQWEPLKRALEELKAAA